MSSPSPPSLSASTITKADLDKLLLRYDALIDKLNAQGSKKGPGKGEATEDLKTLDRIRYIDIPQRLATKKAEGSGDVFLEKEEVETLMRWKLKHGKFRPRLTQLLASNSPSEIRTITRTAYATYASNTSTYLPAINQLCKLKGVGVATASLILAVYDPEQVPFFADELFRWVCWDERSGWGRGIKYDLREYEELWRVVGEVRGRLGKGCGAVDLEKGAFVLGREGVMGGEDDKRMGRTAKNKNGSPGLERAVDAVGEKQGEEEIKHVKDVRPNKPSKSASSAQHPETDPTNSRARASHALKRKAQDSGKKRVENGDQVELRRSKRSKVH